MQPCCELDNIDCACPLGYHGCSLKEELQRLQAECRRLAELSYTDPHTGVFNYRYFIFSLEQEMERTRRTALPTSLVMIDLDYFKQVNDRYGHDAGDEALRWACWLWRSNIRRLDILCRYGGEEFALILPATRLASAVKTAQRLQTTLAENPLNYDGETIPLTASLGVAFYQGQENFGTLDLVKRADDYLRQAKAGGRNRCFYDDTREERSSTEVSAAERSALFPAA